MRAGEFWLKRTSFFSKRPFLGFIAPGMLFYTLFMIFPLIFTIYLSFTSWNGVNSSTMTLIGAKNYIMLFTRPDRASIYWNAFGNNLKFIAFEYVVIIPFQVIIAYLFFRKIPGHRVFQSLYFLPYVFSPAIIGFFSVLVFNSNFGLVNNILLRLGMSKMALPAWYGDPAMNFPLMMFTGMWHSSCIGMFIILSNMKSISLEMLEAGTIDGASEWQKFWYIIVPELGPAMINIVVLDAIWGITVFDLPYILAGTYGGVGGVLDFVNMYFYRFAFGSGGMSSANIDYGFAAAISSSTLVFILILTIALRRLLSFVKPWNE
jgi:ABC-type sugar transport system permease subunit